MKRFLWNTACILLPVVLLFGVLEGAARMAEVRRPPMRVDIGQGFDRDSLLFIPGRDGVMETHPDKQVSFRAQRFAMPKPSGVLRIFALGGSSVNYLDYEFSQLARQLQEAWAEHVTSVEIINCGGLSYGSHRLVLIAAEIMHYEPDLVLIYSGHNEFEEIQQMHLANLEFATTQRALSRSALFRFIRDWRARRAIADLEEARERRELAAAIPDSSKAWLHRFSPEEVAARMDAFRHNLGAIIQMCQDHATPVVIGTTPSNLYRPNLPGEEGVLYEEVTAMFDAGQYEEGVRRGRDIVRHATPRHQSSDAENEIIREVAQAYDVPLADIEAAVIAAEPNGVPGETLFGDHCHLNAEGNRILREVYQEIILRLMRPGDAQPS